MTARLVDLHCHLDLFPDPEAAFTACDAAGVYTLAVTTTPRAWSRNDQLARGTKYVRAALGLHPQLVGERWQEYSIWEELLPKARYVGEVGLDAGPAHVAHLDKQKDIFASILQRCAREGGKILTVHSVRSATPVLDLVERHLPRDRGRVVLHWFTGSAPEAQRAVEMGCYFSINSEMLVTRRRDIVRVLPSDRILTETDGPFVQVNGRPAMPADVVGVVRQLAQLRGASLEATTQLMLRNLRELVGEADDTQENTE